MSIRPGHPGGGFPVEILGLIISEVESTKLDPLLALALVDRTVNSLVTPSIYRSVTPSALPTLLARVDLAGLVRRATLRLDDGNDSDEEDIMGNESSQGDLAPLEATDALPEEVDRAMQLLRVTTELQELVLSVNPDSAFWNLFPITRDTPRSLSLPLEHLTSISLTNPYTDWNEDETGLGYDAELVVELFKLPALRCLAVNELWWKCKDRFRDVADIGDLHRTSSVTDLRLTECRIDASVLAVLLQLPRALSSLQYEHANGHIIVDEAEMDLTGIGAALNHVRHSLKELSLATAHDVVHGMYAADLVGRLPSLHHFPQLTRLSIPLIFIDYRSTRLAQTVPRGLKEFDLFLHPQSGPQGESGVEHALEVVRMGVLEALRVRVWATQRGPRLSEDALELLRNECEEAGVLFSYAQEMR